MTGDPFDDFLDVADIVPSFDEDDDRFDLYKDDGWSNNDLMMRRHVVAGEYVGAKDESRGCPGAASWGNAYDGSLSRWRVKCDCGFLVEALGTAEAAEDTYRWHKGLSSQIGDWTAS